MENAPQIIALQEVKPKNCTYERTLEEYKINGYEIIDHNLYTQEGRGLLMYVRSGMKCNNVELNTQCCEYCSIEVKCKNNVSVLITSIYRSPNSTEVNNGNLLQLLQEISETNYKYKLVLGDFNLPHINWRTCTSEAGPMGCATVFIEKIRDCFFTQHIMDITRFRGDNIGNTLDLLFSNDESTIEEVTLSSPLGRSDHACLQVKYDLQEVEAGNKKVTYMYEKANYSRMKSLLDIDWCNYLPQELTTEEKWMKFSRKLRHH